MKINDHLFASIVHGGILLAIFCLVMFSSCKKPIPTPEPNPVADFFKEIQDVLDTATAKTITILGVDDNCAAGPNLQRQIRQEIIAQLHNLESIEILEYPQSELDAKFVEMGTKLSEGISPENATELAGSLEADTLLYASIETTAPDVHIKVYSGTTGAIIFAETLQGWQLPITASNAPLDLGGGTTTSENPPPTEQPAPSGP
ncbi:MAG: hypothetical protein NTY09_01545 [bacterium]|nr:hypothetical protein [bacterium]